VPCAEKYLYFMQSPTYTFVVGLLLFCQHVKDFFLWLLRTFSALFIDTTLRATLPFSHRIVLPSAFPSSFPFSTRYPSNVSTHANTYTSTVHSDVSQFLFFTKIWFFLLKIKYRCIFSAIKFVEVILCVIYINSSSARYQYI